MLIDWHTHVWEADQLGSWHQHLPRVVDTGKPELHEAAMEAAEVEQFVVIALTSKLMDLEISNDYIANFVDRHPGRAIGVACVDPNVDGACEELERAATELKLSGLKLSPPYQGFHPHDDIAWELYELAERLGLFLIFHQGWVFHPDCSLDAANPLLLDPVARAYPRMKMVIAHLGQPWITETIAVMSRHKNVLTDISARLNRPWQLYNGLMSAMDYGVIDRVVFGTDFPVITPAEGIERLRGLSDRLAGMPEIPPEVIEDMLYRRPLTMLDHGQVATTPGWGGGEAAASTGAGA